MQSKSIIYLLLVNFVLLALVPVHSLAYEELWWNDDWSFKQEVSIPIDTSTEIAKYQPIDVHIEFANSCWTKNENEHSIRVIFQNGENLKELESQIYDLEYIDDSHIKACSLVFLIPEEANGREQYYIYYDDFEKSAPNYSNHIDIEESSYFLEPIPGYSFESRFYKILEEGYVVYAVVQEGEFMEYKTSQHITKLKENTTEVLPKNGELFASFDFRYYYGQEMFDYSSTSQRLVSKEKLVDGNLMISCRIISRSKKDDVQTTTIYKYYYCPTRNKRIHTHVKHETLRELKVANDVNTDGTYARLQCGGIKSTSLQDLNFGEILPYLHLFNEMDRISEYPLDPDPDYIPDDPAIRVLSTEDDVDLGKKAWASFDEGLSGISHSLILGSTTVIQSGQDERDGIQVKAYEIDFPHLPGLEGNTATFEFGRNSYEHGTDKDLIIPKGFVVEFDAEFFSSQTGGYSILQEETDIFQSLVSIKPSNGEEFSEDDEETDTYSLTVFVHFGASIPFGSGLSVLTGMNFSYLNAEVFKEEEFICSGSAGRLSVNPLPSLDEASLIGRIVATFPVFDWKNLSLFKKITFQNLESGKYLVKIYRENPFFGKERKYIGFKIVDVKEDTKTRAFCRSEGSVCISVVDNSNREVKGAEVLLLKDDVVITKNVTDDRGQALIKAPCSIIDSYDLKILYNGFVIYEERIKLGSIRKVVPIKKSIEIERYNFKLEVVDAWGLHSAIELNPVFASKEMDEPAVIYAEKLSAGNYLFTNLIPSSYQLSLKYKSFSLEKNIQVPGEGEIHLVFSAEFDIKLNTLDSRGIAIHDAKIIVSRGGKDLEERSETSGLFLPLPPGLYSVNVYSQDDLIGSRKINVLGERSFDLITTQEPLFPFIVTIFAIAFAVVALVFTHVKKDVMYFLKTLSVSLAITAIVFPWWILHGSSSQVETSTKMFLIPLELVTTTITPDIIAGELAFLPEIFVDVVSLIPLLTVIGCVLVLSSMFFKNFNKKLYFLSLTLAFVVFIGSLLIFSVGMSKLTEVGVGGFMGGGNLDIGIPGEETFSTIFCNWGPSNGFYLYVVSNIILFFSIIFNMRKKLLKRTN